jgi:hypothetical protein
LTSHRTATNPWRPPEDARRQLKSAEKLSR